MTRANPCSCSYSTRAILRIVKSWHARINGALFPSGARTRKREIGRSPLCFPVVRWTKRTSRRRSVSWKEVGLWARPERKSRLAQSPVFLSLFLFRSLPQPGYTNKLDQTDSRWVVRVVWIWALLRPDSNLRSWVDFSLGHRQIYLAAAVVARFASPPSSSFSLRAGNNDAGCLPIRWEMRK